MGINFPVNMNIVVIPCPDCKGTGKSKGVDKDEWYGKCCECGGSGNRVVSSDNLRPITDKGEGQ